MRRLLQPTELVEYNPRPGDNCVLWFPGQDDGQSAVIRDRSGSGNNGTVTAGWAQESTGIWVNSFAVDSNITVANDADFQGTGDFTIVFWVKFNALSVNFQGVVFANQASRWGMQTSNLGAVKWFVTDAGGDQAIDSAAKSTGVWYCMVCYADDTNSLVGFEMDGVAVGAPVALGTRNANTGGIIIGDNGNAPAGALRLDGRVWGVRYFNSVLSPTVRADFYKQERHLFGV